MHSATVAESVRIEGRGIFSGQPCAVELVPAPAGSGIRFIKQGERIPAHPASYIEGPETANTSGFTGGGQRVLMTEHLMAALWCAGIDTADVHCTGPELPNVDGSALLYYAALEGQARKIGSERPELTAAARIHVSLDKAASGSPYIDFDNLGEPGLSYEFDHPELGCQLLAGLFSREWVAQEILPARTFITINEAQELRARGILQHADDSIAVVLTDGVPNSPLRYPDELARHKLLDLLGDLYCLPFELHGRINAVRSGHRLNRELARKLLASFTGSSVA